MARCCAARRGEWDARGARVTTALSLDPLVLLYDGRATRIGELVREDGRCAPGRRALVGSAEPVVVSPEGTGAFRYASAVPLPDGRTRFYFEAARADGSHDLMTSVG